MLREVCQEHDDNALPKRLLGSTSDSRGLMQIKHELDDPSVIERIQPM